MLLPITVTALVDSKQTRRFTCYSKIALHSIRHLLPLVLRTWNTLQSTENISWWWQTDSMVTVKNRIRMCSDGRLASLTCFSTSQPNGVRDTHYFTINRRKFLSSSNLLQVSVYEWQNSKSSSKIQDIQIRKPRRCNTFTIDRVTYIACGRSLDSGADFTTFLAWSGEQFEPFWHHSESSIYGQQNVFIANDTVYFATRNIRQNAVSRIFSMTGIEFIYHQSIQIWPYAKGWESFTTPKGEVFVVVANYEYHKYTQSYAGYKVRSAVYKFADNRLNLYQQLPTTGAVYVHAFTHKGKIYVAVVNHFNGTSFNLNSEIYVWN